MPDRVDLILRDGFVIDVHARDIFTADVAIKDGRIVCIGDLKDLSGEEINVTEMYISPGFMDAHIHIESSKLSPEEFSRVVLLRGTTSVFIDPHESANVAGKRGVDLFLRTPSPLRIFVLIPSCVPAVEELDVSGARIDEEDILSYRDEEMVVGLAEVMNYHGLIGGDGRLLSKVHMAMRIWGVVDGHAPLLSGKDLCKYMLKGPQSDHESTCPDEVLEKLRLGMYVMLREGSASQDMRKILPVVLSRGMDTRRCLLCCDDRSAEDLLEKGHVDHNIRLAIEMGADPIQAIQMATINVAERFRLHDLGSLAPGKKADVVVLKNLEKVKVVHTIVGGRLVVRGGRVLEIPRRKYEQSLLNTVRIPKKLDLRVRTDADRVRVRVIEADEGSLLTGSGEEELKVRKGIVLPDPEKDVLQVCVIERHSGVGSVGKAFVRGFGIRNGALASTVSHDSHNLVVVGDNFQDMEKAIEVVRKLHGGQAVVSCGRVLAELQLPLLGIMSVEKAEIVAERSSELRRAARFIKSNFEDPFSVLSFITLPVIPKLRVTCRGLIDVTGLKVIDPVISTG